MLLDIYEKTVSTIIIVFMLHLRNVVNKQSKNETTARSILTLHTLFHNCIQIDKIGNYLNLLYLSSVSHVVYVFLFNHKIALMYKPKNVTTSEIEMTNSSNNKNILRILEDSIEFLKIKHDSVKLN